MSTHVNDLNKNNKRHFNSNLKLEFEFLSCFFLAVKFTLVIVIRVPTWKIKVMLEISALVKQSPWRVSNTITVLKHEILITEI